MRSTGGEGLATEPRFTVLGADVAALDPAYEDQANHEYTVGATDGSAVVRVDITPYALQRGDKAYSHVAVTGVNASESTNRQSRVETYVTPPLMTEEERRRAASHISAVAIQLALLDVREPQ